MKNFLFILLLAVAFAGCGKDGLCPTGFTGPGCSEELLPNRLIINGLTVTHFPDTDYSGNYWDVFDLPDLYIKVVSSGGNILYTGAVKDNINPYSSHYFPFNEILYPPSYYTVYLYDFDAASSDDYIGYVNLIHTQGQGLPNPISFSNGGISLQIDVEYKF